METLEHLRNQVQDRGSSSSSSTCRLVNRHGHHSRSSSISVAVETGKDRRDSTVEKRNGCDNSTKTSLQKVSAEPIVSKPYRISDLIPRNWECSNDKGEFRHFMSGLHLWMHAWSDEGKTVLVSVEITDRFEHACNGLFR